MNPPTPAKHAFKDIDDFIDLLKQARGLCHDSLLLSYSFDGLIESEELFAAGLTEDLIDDPIWNDGAATIMLAEHIWVTVDKIKTRNPRPGALLIPCEEYELELFQKYFDRLKIGWINLRKMMEGDTVHEYVFVGGRRYYLVIGNQPNEGQSSRPGNLDSLEMQSYREVSPVAESPPTELDLWRTLEIDKYWDLYHGIEVEKFGSEESATASSKTVEARYSTRSTRIIGRELDEFDH